MINGSDEDECSLSPSMVVGRVGKGKENKHCLAHLFTSLLGNKQDAMATFHRIHLGNLLNVCYVRVCM